MNSNLKVKLKNSLLILVGLLVFLFYQSYWINNQEIQERKETTPTISESQRDFKIYFIDVGEADCILIENNYEYTLIDAGNNKDGKKLVEYFKSLGIEEFQYVIGTHAHEDHIGGMDNIIKNFAIKHFYMPDTHISMITYEEILEALEKKKIKYETPNVDTTFQMSDTKFKILWISKDEEELNDTSIVLKVYYKNTSYLLMADATYNVEEKILEKDVESDLIKIAHHGSNHSSGAVFLKKVNPKYAIISVGKDNDYGFPKQVVLDKLDRMNVQVFRTDEQGTIIATSNGNDITFETVKTDTNYVE